MPRKSKRSTKASPKTTRPEAIDRRPPQSEIQTGLMGRTFDAVPDRIDIRDWVYRPGLHSLPDVVINCDRVPFVLDQGGEGACTGFALAAVINFHLRQRNLNRSVSPRMLYELARRYDEWPGEQYEGSSARGAVKGWIAHGVCREEEWPYSQSGIQHFNSTIAEQALLTPGGAYYRVSHREVRDMHAALAESGILYMTLMVHEGWQQPGPHSQEFVYVDNGNLRRLDLPVIARKGRALGGHAVAIVGYTPEGFVIQNSWGTDWGNGGFALLPYEDYMLHATDVWVAQLGVPVRLNLWEQAGNTDEVAGIHRAAPAVPLQAIRPFVVNLGNNGELSETGQYWTTPQDIERLITEEIPQRSAGWKKVRILLYLHGGLNSADYSARRIISYRNRMLANEIYPVNIMWETGFEETLKAMFNDLFVDVDERAGGPAEWLRRFREGLIEAKDRSIELTAALPGTALWNEMKENARLASNHPDGRGGMQILASRVKQALSQLDDAYRKKFELHVIGHSAGAIFAAHALPRILESELPLKTVQFFAPAIRVDLFKQLVLPYVELGQCPLPTLYLLSDSGERDDTVGPYGKSLLFLVSNAFERRRETPLLGMERFVSSKGQTGNEHTDADLNSLFQKESKGLSSLVIAGARGASKSAERSQSNSHGGFDDDPVTLNSALRRIVGGELQSEFTVRDLQF